MILVLDENMPPKVAAALQVLGVCETRYITDHLPRGSPDEDVFRFVAEKSWVLLTQDHKIARRPHQVGALKEAGIGAFILTGRATRTVSEMMSFLLEVLPEMERSAARTPVPFVIGISDRRKFQQLA